jgi:hypothetical protein
VIWFTWGITNPLLTFDCLSSMDLHALAVALSLFLQLIFVALIYHHLIFLDFIFSWWDICFEESSYSERSTSRASAPGNQSVLSVQPSKSTSTSRKCHYCSQGKLDTNRSHACFQIIDSCNISSIFQIMLQTHVLRQAGPSQLNLRAFLWWYFISF